MFEKLEVSIVHVYPIPLSISSIKANYIDIDFFRLYYCLLSFPLKAHFLFLSPSMLIRNTEIIHILCMTEVIWIVVLVPTVSRGIHWTIGYYWPPSLIKTMRIHIGYLILIPIRNLTKRIWQLCSFSFFSHYTHMFIRRRISQLRATIHLSHSHQMSTKSKLTHPFFSRIIAMNNTIVFLLLFCMIYILRQSMNGE